MNELISALKIKQAGIMLLGVAGSFASVYGPAGTGLV